eukprot:SAG31_NODE_2431_length_5707_cov_2.157810_1_plen_68_part_00
MGSPRELTRIQLDALHKASEVATEELELRADGSLESFSIPPYGCAVIRFDDKVAHSPKTAEQNKKQN